MTPNLLVATQKVFSPHKWFKTPQVERPVRNTEYWEDGPVPGFYEYIPGRGKYLIAILKDAPLDATKLKTTKSRAAENADSSIPKEYVQLERPLPIIYARAIRRWFLEPDYKERKKQGVIKNERGKNIVVSFFRTDDHAGKAWIQCWDQEGTFIPGPYQKWCIDAETKQFRHMRHRDDPDYIRSRNNSTQREGDSRSQDSMSTEYRASRPSSTKNGPSAPSTRANSILLGPSAPSSRAPSQHPSRAGSPLRNNSVALEEAKSALRRMALEQEQAVARLGTAPMERGERGRTLMRVGN